MKLTITCCLLFFLSSCYKVDEKTTTAAIKIPKTFLWKGTFPKKLYYSSSLSGDPTKKYPEYTTEMAQEWNDIHPLVDFIEPQDGLPTSETYSDFFIDLDSIHDAHNTVYLVDQADWPTDSYAALGVAILLGRVNDFEQYVIEEVDILIKSNRDNYDARSIILHELGHFLGLQHQNKLRYSVMYPEIAMSDKKWIPHSIDQENLAQLYNIQYDHSGKVPRQRVIPEGSGQIQRMVIELNADMLCRHMLEGVEVHSHHVKL